MDRHRIVESFKTSDELKRVCAILEREYGIRPLREGEHRPDGYYTPDHYVSTGMRPVKSYDEAAAEVEHEAARRRHTGRNRDDSIA